MSYEITLTEVSDNCRKIEPLTFDSRAIHSYHEVHFHPIEIADAIHKMKSEEIPAPLAVYTQVNFNCSCGCVAYFTESVEVIEAMLLKIDSKALVN